MDIEIRRGYEVLPDNDVRFGIRITNNTDAVITDIQVILDYNESLLKLEDGKVHKLDSIPPTVPRTVKYILKPLGCVHKEFVEATITYRDHRWEKHVITMKPKEIHCVCPFLRPKPITKTNFFELSNSGHSVETGINFQGVNASQLKLFLMQSCANRLHKVDEYSIDDGEVIYFSSESVGEKAYYLLTVLIKEQEGFTQVMQRAVSDKTHGIHGFLNEIVSELKHMVKTVDSAKEIGVIKHEHVINIIDSVVQRSSFSIGNSSSALDAKDSVMQRSKIESESSPINIHDSVVQHTAINTNLNKRNNEEIALIAHENHEQVDELHKEEGTESAKQSDKRKLLIPILALILLGILWFGFSGSTDNHDTIHVQEPVISSEVLAADKPENLYINNDDSIDDISKNINLTNSTNGNDSQIANITHDTVNENYTDHIITETITNKVIPKVGTKTYNNSIGMEFVQIPEGKFKMGSNDGPDDEQPIHEVTMGKAFYIGKYEVTQEQWFAVMENNPSRFIGDNNPVEGISWNDAQDFIVALNEIEGTDKYRLPSEAEWEYACRAGTSTKYFFGDSISGLNKYSWYSSNSETKTQPVGQKMCNLWGLYDMHGNVHEWVQDNYHPIYKFSPVDGSSWEDYSDYGRVIRGGSWNDKAANCRSTSRFYYHPQLDGSNNIGFRVVMDI
ncbi:formylglycine-generating enzyme family protein [Methanolobus sp. ZRKC2]|uniref:formylglycine-generating enzyme family protein n=1 Tax=Methanolobus sp. ZRKC2 TaxID=3125783 RepID=UPI003246E4DB